ncbi:hypothetical protein GCM10027055_06570 [Janibacter alkaliphilus]|uniref:DUF4352 domain-containing protein n=1 Tax=Janibacter alkaliphilus TaxID=1069963 RepID=A0A852X1S5_9MICO|nr:hypothetical protein [Janibacter alkaliphilus]NYG37272.1 hypothetical protein [Janibacter alkaliphilus]
MGTSPITTTTRCRRAAFGLALGALLVAGCGEDTEGPRGSDGEMELRVGESIDLDDLAGFQDRTVTLNAIEPNATCERSRTDAGMRWVVLDLTVEKPSEDTGPVSVASNDWSYVDGSGTEVETDGISFALCLAPEDQPSLEFEGEDTAEMPLYFEVPRDATELRSTVSYSNPSGTLVVPLPT